MNTVALSKTDMAYVTRGTGSPVLLVHGFPLDHSMWDAQVEALSAAAHVIAPDLRGCGKTPLAPGDAERGISMEAHADDLAELLDQLKVSEPITLVGFSMGGYIAWQFVRRHGHQLRALVLCDTRAKPDTAEARSARLEMAESIVETGSAAAAKAMEPKLFAPDSVKAKPEVVAKVREIMQRQPAEGIAAAQRGMAERPDATELLPQIIVPTLVMVGEHDKISPPAEMKKIADAIPGSEYVVIPDAGHMTAVENPSAVNEALVRFVNAVTYQFDRLATDE